MGGNVDSGFLMTIRPRTQPVANHALPPSHGSLGFGMSVVT
jgi:hypothetical protein